MSLEIEHKYLVCNLSFISMASDSEVMLQGYLSRTPERIVRVRIAGEKGYITVKGITKGDTRLEFEYEISINDARQMLNLCQKPLLEKTRYYIDFKGFTWEVDVYSGHLAPLIIAEIELPTSDTSYSLPPFVGQEVTGDHKYYNSNL